MKKATKKLAKAKAKPATRLVPVKGCTYTQRDVEKVIGPALLRLADKHRVDIPQLTPRQVYEDLEADRHNPLWQYINTDGKRAMREWVLQQIQHIMRCVRVEYAHIPELKPTALFESVEDTSIAGDGGTGRAHVVSPDAKDKSGIAKRIADEKVKRLRQAWQALHNWDRQAQLPAAYSALVQEVQAALSEFDGQQGEERKEAAAE